MKPKTSRLRIRKLVRQAPDAVFFGADDGYIRLNHNETTGIIPKSLAEKALLSSVKTLSEYPSYEALHKAIGAYAGVPVSMIQTTNGSDDAIPKLVRLLFEGKKPVILTVPNFPTYERALRIEGVPILPIPYEVLEDTFHFPVAKVLKAIASGKVQGVIFCNPSNPLGVGIGKEDLLTIAEAARKKGIACVVDEAYLEFHGVSGVSLLATHPNVILLRTFSKTFGLAGLRLGYVIASPEIITTLRKLILPWEVNHAAAALGLAVLKEKKRFLLELKKTEKRREAMRHLFIRHGIKVMSSKANFLVCKTANMHRLLSLLEKHKIMVKSMGPASGYLPYLKDCFRISVPGPDVSARAIKAITAALKEFSKIHANRL